MKDFYCNFFEGTANKKYTNSIRQFESYFITFTSGCRLEIMSLPSLVSPQGSNPQVGLTHFAFKVSSKEEVDRLTNYLRSQGITVLGEPRTTGDGYYESLVLDPDGNHVEIVC